MQALKSWFGWVGANNTQVDPIKVDPMIDPIKMSCLQRLQELTKYSEINRSRLGCKIAVLQASIPNQDAKSTLNEAKRNVYEHLTPIYQEDAWLRIAKAQRIIEPEEIEQTLENAKSVHHWRLTPEHDAEFLCKIAKFYMQSNPEKAKELLEQAMTCAGKSRNEIQGILMKCRIVKLLRQLDPLTASAVILGIERDAFNLLSDKKLIVRALTELAKLQFSDPYMDQKSSAKSTLASAAKIAEEIDWDPSVKKTALEEIGSAYIQVDISEALKLAKTLENDKLYCDIAKAQAVNNLDEASNTIDLIKNNYYKIRARVDIADIFSKKDPIKAQELVSQVLKIVAEDQAEILCDLARIQKQIDPKKYQEIAQLALNSLDNKSISYQFTYLKRLVKA